MKKNCWRYLGICPDELYMDCSGKEHCGFYKERRRQVVERKVARKKLRLENKLYLIMNCID